MQAEEIKRECKMGPCDTPSTTHIGLCWGNGSRMGNTQYATGWI